MITAQGFGFGPCAKASAIAAELKRCAPNMGIDFMGADSAFDLAEGRHRVFDSILCVRGVERFHTALQATRYDHVISVMEPSSIVAAKQLNIGTSLVDSLVWFWKWKHPLDTNTVEETVRRFTQDGVATIARRLCRLHPHDAQFVAHALADRTFVQAYPSSHSLESDDRRVSGKSTVTGPIVDDRFLDDSVEPVLLLVTLCGQLNPEVGISDALEYCAFALSLLEEGLLSLASLTGAAIKPMVVGHPAVIERLRGRNVCNGVLNDTMCHLGHEDYYRAVNRSVAIIGPPSITTMYDASVYGKPYVSLPEQHDGHWANYLRANGSVVDPSSVSRSGTIPGAMLASYFPKVANLSERHICELYRIIREINGGKHADVRTEMQREYDEVLPQMANNTFRKELRLVQRTTSPVFKLRAANGARQIAKQVLLLN